LSLLGVVTVVIVFITFAVSASFIVVIVVVVWLLLLLRSPSSSCQHINSTLPNQVTEEARTGKISELALHLQSLEADKRNASFTLHGLTDYNGSGKSIPSLY
jgi:ABC-type transport system involved in Fe-S cluster assembly fused permease/ATPase subunit